MKTNSNKSLVLFKYETCPQTTDHNFRFAFIDHNSNSDKEEKDREPKHVDDFTKMHQGFQTDGDVRTCTRVCMYSMLKYIRYMNCIAVYQHVYKHTQREREESGKHNTETHEP